MVDIKYRVNAAVRSDEYLQAALDSKAHYIFLLQSNVLTLKDNVDRIHEAGKMAFVHLDFVAGIARDKVGLQLLKKLGVDGIITTRTSMIKTAKEAGFITIQRFFIIDSHSIDTAVDSIKISNPDLVEVMPAVIYHKIAEIAKQVNVPVMTAGLIDTEEDLQASIDAGAKAVATSQIELWGK